MKRTSLSTTAASLTVMLFINATAWAQTTITVDPKSVFQTFEGWGTSLCWWANMAGKFSQPTRMRLAQDLFTLDDGGLGLTIVRFNAGGGENPAIPNTMELRARMEGYWPGLDQSYNWDADPTQRAILGDSIEAARTAGLRLNFEVFANSPPWWMTISGSATGNTGPDGKPAENLRPDQYDNFASYLIQVTRFLENTYGIQVDSISPFNEPTSAWWTYAGRQEGCFFKHESMARLISKLRSKLASGGARYQVASPEDWSFPQAISSWDSWTTDTQAEIGRINTHSYSGAGRSTVAARAERAGKRIRMSEYGDGDGTGRTLAATILEDLKYLEASSWVNWQAVSPDNWGMLGNDYFSEAYTREIKFSVMGHFSRFLRPGFRIIGADDPRCLAAYDPAERKLVLVITNFSSSPVAIRFDLSRFKGMGDTAEWYQTEVLNSAGDRLALKAPLLLDASSLGVQLAPASISTFVIQTDVNHAGPNQPGSNRRGSVLRHDDFSGSGIYSLRNVATGLYITVEDPSTTPDTAGASLALQSWQGSAVQKFRMDAVEPGWFRLVNRSSGYDVNVRGASNSTGAQIIQWLETAVEGTPKNSQWRFESNGDGTFRVKSRQSGLYIDVSNLTNTGIALVQNTAGAGTELWTLQRSEQAPVRPSQTR